MSNGKHECRARGCTVNVLSNMLMCRRHWYMVPLDLRRALKVEYRKGVVNTGYISAVRACEDAVAQREHHDLPVLKP